MPVVDISGCFGKTIAATAPAVSGIRQRLKVARAGSSPSHGSGRSEARAEDPRFVSRAQFREHGRLPRHAALEFPELEFPAPEINKIPMSRTVEGRAAPASFSNPRARSRCNRRRAQTRTRTDL